MELALGGAAVVGLVTLWSVGRSRRRSNAARIDGLRPLVGRTVTVEALDGLVPGTRGVRRVTEARGRLVAMSTGGAGGGRLRLDDVTDPDDARTDATSEKGGPASFAVDDLVSVTTEDGRRLDLGPIGDARRRSG